MLDLADLLGPEVLDGFMRGLARRQYHVLLGAGASVGGVSSNGQALPTGPTLASELVERFQLPAPGEANLRRLYAAAVRKCAPDGSELTAFIEERFTNTTPPSWLEGFAKIAWQQVWTLNIDDCLSRAYTTFADTAAQRLVSVSWTDAHRAARESESQLVAVHLHGKASRANRSGELVFDISSYIQAVSLQHRWHRLFGDAYRAQPFLIIGASLDAEIDLQAVFDQGQIAMEHRSIIVLKDIDDLQEDEYRSYGLIPVRATAEDFFDAVLHLLPRYLTQLTNDQADELAEIPGEAVRFLHQWNELSRSVKPRQDRRHDVFKGHEPRWGDAVAGRLAARDVAKSLAPLADPSVAEPSSLLHVMSGPSLSGKTAALLGAALNFVDAGFRVFQFDSQVAPDIPALYWWIQRFPKTILLFDDAADFAKDIAAVYKRAADSLVVPRVLAVERSRRLSHIDNVLVLTPRVDHSVTSTISNPEIRSVIGVLAKNNRLGDLTGKSDLEQFNYFAKEHQRELFGAMANLERGRGFQARVLQEYDSLQGDVPRRLLGVAALAGYLGYGMPAEVVLSSTGISSQELNVALRGELGDLLLVSDGALHLRHRFMGQVLVEQRLSVEDKFDIALRLGMSVAPYVSKASISISSTYYRLARALMGHEMLAEILDGDHDCVLSWYERLQDAFDWNARFWEQRALAAADATMFEPAYSWAREAVTRRRDSLTLNTVGAVLMRRAVYELRSGLWPAETYELAEAALREARTIPDSNEYPYDTFFRGTLRLVQSARKLDSATRTFLVTAWNEWYVSILARDEVTRARLHERVQDLGTQWSRLMETDE